MLKQSTNALGMLISKYRSVLKKMFIKNAAALAATGLLFTAAPAWATDYKVGPGKDYANLDALRQAGVTFQDGDYIYMFASDSSLNVYKPLDFNGAKVTIEPRDDTNIRFIDETAERTIIFQNASNVTVRGFETFGTSTAGGSAVYLTTGSTLRAERAAFEDNSVNIYINSSNNSSGSGGAAYLYNNSTLNAIGATFFHNTVNVNVASSSAASGYGYGGAVYLRGGSTLRADGATFEYNYVHVSGSPYGNSYGYGGAGYLYGSTLNAIGATFQDNFVQISGSGSGSSSGSSYGNSYGYGGAVCLDGSTLNAGRATFENNFVNINGGDYGYGGGGAVYLWSGSELNAQGATFQNNFVNAYVSNYSGNSYGGAVSLYDSTLNADGATFENNSVNARGSGGGGAVYLRGSSTLNARGATFLNNAVNVYGSGSGYGGAIYADASYGGNITLNLSADDEQVSLFDGNTDSSGANSIYFSGGNGYANILNVSGAGTLDMRDPMNSSSGGNYNIAINKTDSGTWKLGGVNNFRATGTTFAVKEGTLDLGGGAAVAIAKGSFTLGTSSTYATLISRLDPATGTGNTITAPTITLNKGSTLAFDIDGVIDNHNYHSTANLTLTGNVDGQAIGAGTIDIYNTTALTRGTYTLVKAANAGFAATGDVLYNGQTTEENRQATAFSLIATSDTLQMEVGDLFNSINLTWTGSDKNTPGPTVWNQLDKHNWAGTVYDKNGKSITQFLNGDMVTFGNTGAGVVTVAQEGVVVNTMTVNNSAGNDYTFNGGSIGGFNSLTKNGAGTLTLNNANTFTDGVWLNGGTINIGNNSALGADSLTMADGTTLGFNGSYTVNNALTVTGSVTIDVGGGSTGGISGDITGGSFTKTGEGALTLGNNSHVDNATLQTGTLEIDEGKTLTVEGTAALGADTTLSVWGGLALEAGTVTIGGNATIDITSLDATALEDGPVILITSDTTINQNFENITIGGVEINNSQTSLDKFIEMIDVQITADSKGIELERGGLVWNNTGENSAHGTFKIDKIFVLNADLTNNPDNNAYFGGWDGETLTKTGDGILILTGENTYTGQTQINEGTLVLTKSDNILAASPITLGTNGTNNTSGTLRFAYDASGFANGITLNNGGGTINTGNNTVELTGLIDGDGGLTKTGAGELTLSGGNGYIGGTTINEGVLIATNISSLGIGGTVANNAELTLLFTGTFDYALTGGGMLNIKNTGSINTSGIEFDRKNSEFTGITNLLAGRADIAADNALGTGGINMSGGTALGFTNGSSISNSINITGGVNIDVTGSGNTGTINGTISGDGGLTKKGDGELILANANTYGSGTTIRKGTLTATDKDALGEDEVEINQTAVLNIEFDGEFKNEMSGQGDLNINGKIEINWDNSGFTGDTYINSGRVDIGTAYSLGTGGITMNNATALGFNDSFTLGNDITLNDSATFDTKDNDVKLTGTIGGDGSLTKTGAGTLILDDASGANTYEGGTYINEGTLIAKTSAALGYSTSEVEIGQAAALTLEYGGIFDHILTGSGTLNINGDYIELNNVNTGFTGTTNLATNKTLIIGDNEALGTATLKMAASSALGFTGDDNNYSLANNITIALGGAAVDTGTNDVSLTGIINGIGGLTKDGTGGLTLTGSNSYWGGTDIIAGTLTATGQNALGRGKVDVGSTAILNLESSGTFDNRLSGGGDLNIYATTGGTTPGTITFTRANIGFTGDTALYIGNVNIGKHYALGGGSLVMKDDTSLSFTGSYILGNNITIADASIEIDVENGFTGTIIKSITGNDDTTLTKTGGGTLTLGSDSSVGNVTLAEGTLNIASGKTLTVAETATLEDNTTLGVGADASNPALTATTVDIGSNVTIDINSYVKSATPITLVQADTINNDFNKEFYIGGVLVKDYDITLDKFVYGTSVTKDTSDPDSAKILLDTGGLVWEHTQPETAHGTFNVATSIDLKVSLNGRDIDKNTNDFGWDGQTLTKTGAGTLILSGTNTYTGATHINEGTLTLKAEDSIASISQITIGTDTTSATLQLDYTGVGILDNNITISRKDGTIDVTGETVTLKGIIGGDGGLIKTGESELILTNANNDYKGGTYIAAGTLTAQDKNALSTGAVYVQQDAALTLGFSDEFKNSLSGGGELNIGGTISINNTNADFSGTTNITDGNTLTVGNAQALGSSGIYMGDSSTLGFNGSYSFANNITLNTAATATFAAGSNDVALTGTITGEGGLTKTGDGSLTLTNANNYKGGTVVSTGTLVAKDANALGTGGVDIGDNALTLEFNGEFKNGLEGYADSTLNIIGKVTVNQANIDFKGMTNLSSGSTVKIGHENALGDGDINMGASSTLSFIDNNTGYSLDNNITLAFGGATVNTSGQEVTLNGEITRFGLTKEGAGELILTNANNTYLGGTTISGGTLTATNKNALGRGKVEVQSGTELNLNFVGTFDNRLSGGGGLNIDAIDSSTDPDEITFTKANIGFYGNTTINSGRVNNANYLALGTGTITMNNGTALGFNDSYTLRNKITLNSGSATFDTDDNDVKLTGTITGDGGLVKEGGGSLALTNANNYEGGTVISAGTLVGQDASALGTSDVKVGDNTFLTLEFDGEFKNELLGDGDLNIGGTVAINTTNDYFKGNTNILSGKTLNIGNEKAIGTSDVNMAASSTLGLSDSYSLANNIAIAFGGATVNTAGNNATLTGEITGFGSLTKEGEGELTLTNANTYSGGTNINAGTLTATDENALGRGKVEVQSGTELNLKFNGTFDNRLTGEGCLNIDTTDGAYSGAIEFTKINTGFSGDTVLNTGSIIIGNHLALGTGNLSMKNGTELGFTGSYLLGNDINISDRATIYVAGSFTGTILKGINSDGNLFKTGDGTLTLGDNSSIDNVTLTEGTLDIAAGKSLRVNGTATLEDYTTLGVGANLALEAGEVTISGDNVTIDMNSYVGSLVPITVIKSETAIAGDFGKLTIGGVEITEDISLERFISGATLGKANEDKEIRVDLGGLVWNNTTENTAHGTFNVLTSFDLKANLSDNEAAKNSNAGFAGWDGQTLTKTGEGTLIMTGTNTYTGATHINNGTLVLNGAGNIIGTSGITLGTDAPSAATTSGTLQFDYNTGNDDFDKKITINSGGGIIDVTYSHTATLNGEIDGLGGLTKDGAGELILTNANIYVGDTTIAAGTLTAANKNALSGGSVEIQNNADLNLAFNGEFTNSLSGEGDLNIQGNITINNDNSEFNGTTNHISGNTLTIGTAGALGGSDLNIGISSTLLFDYIASFTNNITLTGGYASFDTAGNSVSLDGTGTITGGGVLAKKGAGELVLTNANTYTGGTYIAAGELTATNANALGTGAVQNDAVLNLQFNGEFKNNLYGGGDLNINGKIAINQNNGGFSGTTSLKANSIVGIGNNYTLGTGGIIMGDYAALKFSGNYSLANDITFAPGTSGSATVNTGGYDAALTGTIDGDGSLIKDGEGKLTLTNANTYTGGTTIEAGTLTVTNVNALGKDGAIFIDSDAALEFDLSLRQSGSVENEITGGGDLVKSGGSILTLANTANNYSDLTITVNDGLLRVTVDEGAELAAIENNAQLNFVGTELLEFARKEIYINTYSGSGTLGIQASLTSPHEKDQWCDYLTFATTPQDSVNVHFYFEPGSKLRYMPAEGLTFATLTDDGGNDGTFILDGSSFLAGAYLLGIKADDNYENYILTSAFSPSLAKVYSEVAAATMAQASGMHGRELFDATSQAAKSADGKSAGVYAGFGGTDARYKTGSHADVAGNNFAIALAWQANEKTAWGIFGQMLKGSYTTSHETMGYTINSNGDLDTNDFGLFAEYRPAGQKADDTGHYYKAVVRAGRSSNDFRTNNYLGDRSSFRSDRNLFGASIGGGYVKNSGQDKTVEYYTHLIYTGLGGDNVTDSVGQDISFNSDNSLRLLSGLRLNLAKNKKTSTYLGAALDYEFCGKTNAYINGYKADSANLNGLTGVLELGFTSKQSDTLTINGGLQGYMGKKQGLGGTLTLSKKF